jgi:hypothetical protein
MRANKMQKKLLRGEFYQWLVVSGAFNFVEGFAVQIVAFYFSATEWQVTSTQWRSLEVYE